MVAKVRLIAKASFSVMALKSLFLYSLFIIRQWFMRKATPPLWPVEWSFLTVSQPVIWKFSFLLRNVSLRAIMSITFSFRYNSSSLCFALIPWQFKNKMFKPMKVVRGYLPWMMMCYSGLLGGFRLLGESLGGIIRWFWWTSLLWYFGGGGGEGAEVLREPIDSNRSF